MSDNKIISTDDLGGVFSPALAFMASLDQELGQAIKDCTKSTMDTGKASSLTLKIDIKMVQGMENHIVMSNDVKVKPAKEDSRPTFWYARPNGDLLVDDPEQKSMFVREVVDTDSGEIREVSE